MCQRECISDFFLHVFNEGAIERFVGGNLFSVIDADKKLAEEDKLQVDYEDGDLDKINAETDLMFIAANAEVQKG